MGRTIFAPRAVDDLRSIHEFIARDNPDAALRLIQRIEAACDDLAEQPEMGVRRFTYGRGLRMFPVDGYLVFYRVKGNDVQIVRVLHGRRDVRRTLNP